MDGRTGHDHSIATRHGRLPPEYGLSLLLPDVSLSDRPQNNETPGTSHSDTPASAVPITVAASTSLG